MKERIFTPEELKELYTPTMDRAIAAIDAGEYDRAKELCRAMDTEHLLLHDLYRDWAAALLTHIGNQWGDSEILKVLRFSAGVWWKPFYQESQAFGAKRFAEELARVIRSHCGAFRVEEDVEKFTFIMDPCGSGGRLRRDGFYDPPQGFLKVKKAQPLTFGREDFPVYCSHCAVIHQIVPIEWGGYPVPVMVPATNAQEPCYVFIYKDPQDIPAECYRRVGKEKPPRIVPVEGSIKGQLVFSPEELKELYTPTMDRAIAAIDSREYEKAKKLCGEMKAEWFPLHDIYRDWITALLTHIGRNHGKEEEVYAALRDSISSFARSWGESLAGKEIRDLIQELSLVWRSHCGIFRIEEEDDRFVFYLEPCGSGGRLLRERAYEPPKDLMKLQKPAPMTFGKPDFPIYCAHCAVIYQLMIEWGAPHALIVEDAATHQASGSCIHYYYKSPDLVPARFYQVVGKEKEEK